MVSSCFVHDDVSLLEPTSEQHLILGYCGSFYFLEGSKEQNVLS